MAHGPSGPRGQGPRGPLAQRPSGPKAKGPRGSWGPIRQAGRQADRQSGRQAASKPASQPASQPANNNLGASRSATSLSGLPPRQLGPTLNRNSANAINPWRCHAIPVTNYMVTFLGIPDWSGHWVTVRLRSQSLREGAATLSPFENR